MTKRIYELKVLPISDINSNQRLVCRILDIDESKARTVTHTTTTVDGQITSECTHINHFINNEYVRTELSDTYFDTIEEVKKHIELEYQFVHSTKHSFFFLTEDSLYNEVVTIANYSDSKFTTPPKSYVNLQELLNLVHTE